MKKSIYFLFLVVFSLSFHSFAQKKQKNNMSITIFFNLSTANSNNLILCSLYPDIEIEEIRSHHNLKAYKCVIPSTYSEDVLIVAIERNGVRMGGMDGKKYEFSLKEIRNFKLIEKKKENVGSKENPYVFTLSS